MGAGNLPAFSLNPPVKLKNVKTTDQMKMTYDQGVLEMHCAYALGASGMFGDNQIQALLMKHL